MQMNNQNDKHSQEKAHEKEQQRHQQNQQQQQQEQQKLQNRNRNQNQNENQFLNNMSFDQVLEEIGEFGRYQQMNYFLICLPVMFAAANSLSYVFTAGTPNYRCFIPECDDTIGTAITAPTITTYKDDLYASWLINATPGIRNEMDQFIAEPCYRYPRNNNTITTSSNRRLFNNTKMQKICPQEFFNVDKTERCFEWIFDPDEKTIVQEWNLTCEENAWKLAFVGTMHFGGLVVGTAMSGYFADMFGRKLIFIICIIFMSITGIAQALSWDYNSFILFAFLNAVGTSGVYPLAFIIGVEMVGPRQREMSSIVLNYFYALGEAMVGLFAWLLPNWQLLQYILSIPPIFFFVYYWIVPESVRWLIARNRNQDAQEIINKAAQMNRKSLSIALLENFENQFQQNMEYNKANCNKTAKKHEIWLAVIDIFKSKTLIIRYTILLYIWTINAIVYYGLSLNSTNLSGNKYLNFALVCLIEIPGYTLTWISLKQFGRRYTLASAMLLCAITCAAGGYVSQKTTWIEVCLFLIGKLGITSSFAVVYAYTAEMMPTIIRSGGVGVMSTFARFGAMIAPFVPLLSTYYKPLPLLLFGGISLSGGLLAFFLPETFRRKLPDTVLEAKQLDKTKPLLQSVNNDKTDHTVSVK